MGIRSGMMPAVNPSKALIRAVGTKHWWPQNTCRQRQIMQGFISWATFCLVLSWKRFVAPESMGIVVGRRPYLIESSSAKSKPCSCPGNNYCWKSLTTLGCQDFVGLRPLGRYSRGGFGGCRALSPATAVLQGKWWLLLLLSWSLQLPHSWKTFSVPVKVWCSLPAGLSKLDQSSALGFAVSPALLGGHPQWDDLGFD